MSRRMALAAVTAVALAATATAQEQSRIRLYGFMDMLASLPIMTENSLFHALTTDDGAHVSIDHFNLYLSAQPTEGVRMLSELSFRPTPVSNGARMGSDIVLDLGNGLEMVLPVEAARGPKHNSDDNPLKGEVFDWGTFSLQRVWAEYQFREYLAFRFGKFITPAGIWNVDHGSPVLITVRQPYQTGLIEYFPEAQMGLMGLGNVFAGPFALNYNLYISSGRNGISIEKLRDIAVGGRLQARVPVLDELAFGISGYSGIDKSPHKSRTVRINPDTAQLMVLESMLEAGSFDPEDTTVQRLVGEKIEAWMVDEGLNPKYHSYGTEYEYQARETSLGADIKLGIQRFELQMEYNYQLVQNYLADNAETHQFGFYGLVSYGIPLGAKVTLRP
ncbi:MAG: hypothetical protein GF331_02835, partial [Chitinivibrionales bacterium]|nr:hypothetical protein [Chitinivibrionales bacterium]